MSYFVTMKAAKAFNYGSRRLAVDEEFQAQRKDVRVLDAIGRAKVVEAEASMQPEKPKAAPTASPKPAKKTAQGSVPPKKYKRRDIKPTETK